MNTQDEKRNKDLPKSDTNFVTGANIAPKGHGACCPCCMPEDDDLDD